MKKILFTSLTGYPNPSIGGPTRIIYELLKNLDYTKYEPYFLSYDMFKKYTSKEDLEVNQIKNLYRKRLLGHKLYESNSIYRKIVTSDTYLKYYNYKRDKYFFKYLKLKWDVIHSHDSLSAFYFKEYSFAKLILTIHSKGSQVSEMNEVKKNSSKFIDKIYREYIEREKESFLKFNNVTFPSIAAKEYFLNDIKVNNYLNEKIKIIYNGINIEKINSISVDNVFNKYGINKSNYESVIINVAQHVKPKNIDIIIKSIGIMVNDFSKNVLMINVGEGYLTDFYKSLVNNYNLNKNVKFLGMIPNDDVIRLIKASDILIQASEKVIFDLVILEALACGATVLVSIDGGNKEIIQHSVNGYFMSSINETAIANDLLNIIDKKRLNVSQNQFSIKNMVNNFELLYES